MSLEGLADSKRLKREPTSIDEIRGLIEVVERSLKDASIEVISEDLRFIAAYNALLTASKIALRAAGYRTPNQAGHHILTFETLQYTIAADDAEIRKLKAFATQRGTATYDAAGSISAGQLRGAIRSAEELQQRVMAWLRAHHPELLQS
jgi:uncharacterized protein (UPF0332 family)